MTAVQGANGANGKNVFAAVLAGGSGTRMGNPDKPKQFWMLGNRPILVQTVEKFCVSGGFEKVIVLCPQTWLRQTQDIVDRYLPHFADGIAVVAGGAQRNDTVMNAVGYIEEHFGLDEETIIVTHDAVRPFVTHRVIQENIEAVRKYGACDTVVPASDTIVSSADGKTISSIPNRAECYQGQTPQSFRAARLMRLFEELDASEREMLTDACKILVLKGEPVAMVRGDVSNIKITYPNDMRVARAMMDGEDA